MAVTFKNNTSTDQVQEELRNRARRRRETIEARARVQPAQKLRNDLLPAGRFETRPLRELRPPERAVRKITPAQNARVRAAIEAFGWTLPLLISDDGAIVDGVTRHAVAQELGLESVPCLVIDHLSGPELRALRVAINRIAEQGAWDFDQLRVELADLIVLDAPIEALGFAIPEIEGLLVVDDPAEDEGELEPDLKAPPVSQPGDVWRLGPHRIACGDARNGALYEELLAGEAARLVLTDVPYNVAIQGHVTSGAHKEFAMASGEMTREAFAEFNSAWMAAAAKGLTDGGLLATFIDWRSVELIIATGRKLELSLLNLVVWAKTNAGMGSLWRSQHELLPVLKKGQAPHVNNVELGKHGRWRSNLWTYAGASSLGSDARDGLAVHPTVKPVAMLVDALLDITQPNDVVVDPFLGSGSTLIAAERVGRRCRAIEIEPAYVDVAIRRWQAATGKTAMLEETGAPFDEVAQQRAQDSGLALEASDVEA